LRFPRRRSGYPRRTTCRCSCGTTRTGRCWTAACSVSVSPPPLPEEASVSVSASVSRTIRSTRCNMARVTSPPSPVLFSTSSRTGNAFSSVKSSAFNNTSSRSCLRNAMMGPRRLSASLSASPILTDAVEGCASCSRKGTPFAMIDRSSSECDTMAMETALAMTHARMMGARTSMDAVASMMITVTAAVMRVKPLSIAADPINAYVLCSPPVITSRRGNRTAVLNWRP